MQEALDDYLVQCIRIDQAQELRNNRIALPSGGGATFAILNGDGQLVIQADGEQVAQVGELDRLRLAKFLETNRTALPDARQELQSALSKAARSNRRVLVQVSGPGCGPCILLSRYLANQQLIRKEYVHVTLDVRMPHPTEVAGKLGWKSGRLPWMAILSSDGQTVVTSQSKEGNIGYPRSESAKAHFKHMLTTTSRRLSEAEIAAVIEGLDGER